MLQFPQKSMPSQFQASAMASLNPCSAPSPCKKAQTTTSMSAITDVSALPLDALWEVLLRLSAKELCRLRVVCRSWRSITSRPDFVAAHAARHPGPLLVGSALEPKEDILVMDLSGNVMKRIRVAGSGHMLLSTSLDLVIAEKSLTCQASVLSPATGAVHVLPENIARPQSNRRCWHDHMAAFTFGKVPMGEYKVLCVLADYEAYQQSVEVITLNSCSPMQWRAKQALPIWIGAGDFSRAVVNGVVYFLLTDLFNGSTNDASTPGIKHHCMALFDLKTEQWMPSYLQGPVIPDDSFYHVFQQRSLAELNGSLVFAVHDVTTLGCSLDLWYLLDLEKCLWERKYRIPLGIGMWGIHGPARTYPSTTLQDGRILICAFSGISNDDFPSECLAVHTYNPETNILGPNLMNAKDIDTVAIYTGSLLNCSEW